VLYQPNGIAGAWQSAVERWRKRGRAVVERSATIKTTTGEA
jgi:hypothetical protein